MWGTLSYHGVQQIHAMQSFFVGDVSLARLAGRGCECDFGSVGGP